MFGTCHLKRTYIRDPFNITRQNTYKRNVIRVSNSLYPDLVGPGLDPNCLQLLSVDDTSRRMAENGFAPPPPPREFCRHILSCRELKAESFKRCLHSVLRGVSL